MAASRVAGTVLLLLLLAGGVLLAALPAAPGAVRLAGLGLLWWYAGLLAPGLGLAAALIAGSGVPARSLALLVGPAFLAALAARVFAGAGEAPVLLLVGLLAPLLAALWPAAARPPSWAAVAAVAAAAGPVLWGHFLVLADAARLAGGERWQGLAAGLGLGAAAALGARAASGRPAALAAGTAAVVGALAVVAPAAGVPPWTAWARVAERPVTAFAESSPWVDGGRAFVTPVTLAFTEPHRVTARADAAWRLTERDEGRPVVRELRLAPGASVGLRPGDQLEVGPGARLSFEPGKRVPGAPASGPVWAAGGDGGPAAVARGLGAVLTLAAGTVALAVPRPAGAGAPAAALLLPLGATWAAAALGLYAALAGPDVALGAPPVAPLLAVGEVTLPRPWGTALFAVLAAAVGALFAAAGGALRDRLLQAVPAPAGSRPHRIVAGGWWALLAGAALAAAALPAGEAWRGLTLGLGLAAAALAAPALVPGPAAARLAGGLAGALVFGLVALGAGRLGAWAGPLADYPALVAVPAAAAVVRLLGR